MGDPLTAQNGQKCIPKHPIFLCQCSEWVLSLPLIVISCMQCLYDVNPLLCVLDYHTIHLGLWGTPSQPKNGQKCTPEHSISLCQCSKWVVSLPAIVKSFMQCLYDVNPHSLCIGPPDHSSQTVRDSLIGQKWAETHPKTPRFPLSWWSSIIFFSSVILVCHCYIVSKNMTLHACLFLKKEYCIT